MIIATAGHVDHGKTALVRQLTGVDTDRLDEEKRRGLSISLGYAYLAKPGAQPIGFIDVPGHQRFINNMIAGVSGIDLALLVVAADDGVMPQTREHLQVLALLQVPHLVIALTKTDIVDEHRLREVKAQLHQTFSPFHWPSPPIFPVSNVTGEGIDTLQRHLYQCEAVARGYYESQHFHVSIDRAFHVKGTGLVVTGTVAAGSVAVADTLIMQPGEERIKVRGLRVHDKAAQRARAGERCALNIVSAKTAAEITRGDWLTAPGSAEMSERIDVRFKPARDLPFAPKPYAPVKLHIGARRVAARLVLLSANTETSGEQSTDTSFAQLMLDEAICTFRGQRFVVRDHAGLVLLGGGSVLDLRAPKAGKSRPQRIALLEALGAPTETEALNLLVALREPICLSSLQRDWNIQQNGLAASTVDATQTYTHEGNEWLVAESSWQALSADLLDSVRCWHAQHPQQRGIKAALLGNAREQMKRTGLLQAVLTELLRTGKLELLEGLLRLPGHRPLVSTEDEQRWQLLRGNLADAGLNIPLLSEIAANTGIEPGSLEQLARRKQKDGVLLKVSTKRYALPRQLHELADALLAMQLRGEDISIVNVKRRWQAGRNLTVELLEYFDSIRFTQRKDQARVVLDAKLPQRVFGD